MTSVIGSPKRRRFGRFAAAIPAAALLAVAALLPAGAVDVPLAFDSLVLKHSGAEPDIAISPSGRVVMVAGLSTDVVPAILYRSKDFGQTFKRIEPTFSESGGFDWDMTFLDDRTIVAADLAVGSGIYVHRSEDDGDTWATTLVNMDVYDRPWIGHFGRDLVYLIAKGFDGIPYLYRSTDGGRSFGNPPIPLIIYGLPGQGGPDPVNAFVYGGLNAYVDHLAVDQRSGDVYVLYGLSSLSTFNASQPLGVSNQLFISHLEGNKMVNYPIYLGDAEDSAISGFNWLTIDPAGTVYALVNGRRNGHHSARVSYSKDHGKTWSPLVDLGPPGAANVYGSIAAGDKGVLSLVYLRGTMEDPNIDQPWYAEMARVTSADTPAPHIGRVRTTSKAIHTQDICFDGILCGVPGFGDNRDLLDFIWNEVSANGKALAVISSDGPQTGSESGQEPDVVVLRQKSGPLHKGAAIASVPEQRQKPKVKGTKTTRPAPGLPATGVGGAPLAVGTLLTACAAGLAGVLRRRR